MTTKKLSEPTYSIYKSGYLGTGEQKNVKSENESGSGGPLYPAGVQTDMAPDAKVKETAPPPKGGKVDDPVEEFKLEKPDEDTLYAMIHEQLSQKALAENVTYTLLEVVGNLAYFSVYLPSNGQTINYKVPFKWDDKDGLKINFAKVTTNASGGALYFPGIKPCDDCDD
jgi:hypothetical protein